MIYKTFKNITLSWLGMGNMRLPSENPQDPNAPIDYAAARKVIEQAYEGGINYFDTAYIYNHGDSEKCLGEVMCQYPRDSYYLATKFYVDANPDYESVFEEQLQRLRTEYIDFYLLHCMTADNIDAYLNSGCIDYFLEQKKSGRIRYFGFSSHADPETLKRFASQCEWDFAQLQINYFDWVYGTAEKEYEVLKKYNIPIMVMEPVRGGRLADLTPETNIKLKAVHPDWSIAAWAMRFVKSKPQIQVVLSGMSDENQVNDNLSTFSTDETLSDGDESLLLEVCKEFREQIQIPCTVCRYCCTDCPMEINIPEYLRVFNTYKVDGVWALEGLKTIESKGSPADCIACGNCARHCPQNITIPDIMRELAQL